MSRKAQSWLFLTVACLALVGVGAMNAATAGLLH
jgi:hypothetical protein